MESSRPSADPTPEGAGAPVPGPLGAPIPPPSRMPPPRIPPPVAAPVAPKVPSNYRPPSQVASKPVYVDPKMLFGFLGGAVLLLLLLVFLKNRGATATGVSDASLELRAGQDVKKNLSGADWATLSLPSAVGKDSLLKTGSDPANVLALADGSSIRLDRNTSAKIVSVEPSGSGQKVRVILYRGRIFVNEGPSSDVTVESKFVNVVPVGTRFAVSQIERSDLTEYTVVRVVEGTVKVTHLDDKTASLVVKAGEEATAAAAVLESPKVAGAADTWIAWNTSWTELDKMPVSASAPAASSAPAAAAAPAPGAPQQAAAPPAGGPQGVPPASGPPPGQPNPGSPPGPGPGELPPQQNAPPQPRFNPGDPIATGPPQQPGPPPSGPQQGPPKDWQPPTHDPNAHRQPGPAPGGGQQPPPQDQNRPLPPNIPVEDATGGGGHDKPQPGHQPPGPGGPQQGPGPASASSGSSSSSSGSAFGEDPLKAKINNTGVPGYAPGSEPVGPSGPVGGPGY